MTDRDERHRAIATADTACPRCGAAREPDQGYCLECGTALPTVTGRVPRLRRLWIRRFGWYPGDWMWVSLLTLAVAGAGAAAAIAVTEHRDSSGQAVVTALAGVQVIEPTALPAALPTSGTATLPTAPEPTPATKPAASNGHQAWPANRSGWAVVLVSYPKTTGTAQAQQTAAQAAKAGLAQVGVLDSSEFASLQPGYLVVFSGIYASQAAANGAIQAVHQAGFGAAYSRPISR